MVDRAVGTATTPTTANVKGHASCNHLIQFYDSMPTVSCSIGLGVCCCLQDVTKMVAGIWHDCERTPAAAKLVDLNCIRTR